MEKWVGKVAVVTGASVGIGADIAIALADAGMLVVGLARRAELIEVNSSKVSGNGKLYARKCDVTNETEVLKTFQWIKKELGGIDVFVNNAGLFRANFLIGSSTDDYKDTFDLNVLSTCVCIREVIKDMRERNFKGHIIILNSILGRRIPDLSVPMFGAYPASKYALTALSETLRQELHFHKSAIKLTCINPGMVDTDMLGTFNAALSARLPKLKVDDVTSSILYCLGTPEHVRIDEITLQAMFSYD